MDPRSASAQRHGHAILVALAVGGFIVGGGYVGWRYAVGMWPPHDTIAYWLAGRHLIEGTPVYGGDPWFLAFLYSPPVALLTMPLALLPYQPVSVFHVALELLALRYVTGSWIAVGLLGWIPWVHYEFIAGNINCLIAAAIYAAAIGQRGAGVAIAIVTFAKLAPMLALVHAPRRLWAEFGITMLVMLALTLPVLHLWPEWYLKIANRTDDTSGIIPFLWRLPVVTLLLLHRRPWSIAAGTALATPIFHAHSIVLLLPAIRLGAEAWRASRAEAGPTTVAVATRPPR